MHAFQNAGGHVGLSARPYPINSNTAIMAGTVVKLSGSLVVKAAAAETGPILGIAAETHTGVEDALNIRSNGEEILVYDNPELIFECAAPELPAGAGGSATTLVPTGLAAGLANDALNGGKVQLVSRAEASTNTDAINEVRPITDYTASGTVITLPAGGTPAAGDVYCIYPPLGSAICALDSTAQCLVLTATGATKIKVVGHDTIRRRLRCMAVEHSLGVEN